MGSILAKAMDTCLLPCYFPVPPTPWIPKGKVEQNERGKGGDECDGLSAQVHHVTPPSHSVFFIHFKSKEWVDEWQR